MYYLAGRLNASAAFRRVGNLQGIDRCRDDCQEVLYRASVIVLNLDRAIRQRGLCLGEFQRHKSRFTLDRNPVIFASQNLIDLVGSVTSALNQLRAFQDRLLPFLGKVQPAGTSLPSSLNEVMGTSRSMGRLPPEVIDLLKAYWQRTGKLVKEYRDLDQHHFAIAAHAVMYHEPEDRLVVPLPDEPVRTGRLAVSYRAGRDAIEFTVAAFEDLDQTLDACLAVLGVTVQRIAMLFALDPRVLDEPVPLSRPQTLAVFVGGGLRRGDMAGQARFTADGRLVIEQVSGPVIGSDEPEEG